jgi:hypothetical protein
MNQKTLTKEQIEYLQHIRPRVYRIAKDLRYLVRVVNISERHDERFCKQVGNMSIEFSLLRDSIFKYLRDQRCN